MNKFYSWSIGEPTERRVYYGIYVDSVYNSDLKRTEAILLKTDGANFPTRGECPLVSVDILELRYEVSYKE